MLAPPATSVKLPMMSGANDCHQSETRHLHGCATVNCISSRCFHLDACRARQFGCRTVVRVDIVGVDRRKRTIDATAPQRAKPLVSMLNVPVCQVVGVFRKARKIGPFSALCAAQARLMLRACTFACGLVGIYLYAGTTGTVKDIKAPLRVDVFPSVQKVRTLICAGNC